MSNGGGGEGPPFLLSESLLAEAWEQRRFEGPLLRDSFGRQFAVVFAGRRWGGAGPDFQGAVLALSDGTLIHGDVEVHRRASDWRRHGHASDAAYAQVILHVVLAADAVALDAFGRAVPTVALRPTSVPTPQPEPPCTRDGPRALAAIEAAGWQRLEERAARFEGDIHLVGADQALWRGIAEALGFARNSEPMGRLADFVPWVEASAIARERNQQWLAARLLGTAGLAAGATAEEQRALEERERTRSYRQMMGHGAWQRAGARPANDPTARIRGMAALAARFGRGGLANALDACLDQPGRRATALVSLAQVAPWIGRGRALVVAANVLVPVAAARQDPRARQLFRDLAPEPPNRASAYMARLLMGRDWAPHSALQQQGLLQVFKSTCRHRACESCPARAQDTGASHRPWRDDGYGFGEVRGRYSA